SQAPTDLPANPSASAPISQPKTTVQNKVTPATTSTTNMRESAAQTPAPTSQGQIDNPGTMSTSQQKTAAPNNRYGSIPITQPMNQPRMIVQDKPSSTPDKATSYSPASTAITAPTPPQATTAPPRVVQVVPPKSE